MNRNTGMMKMLSAVACVVALAAAPVHAEKPADAGGGKPDKAQKGGKSEKGGGKPDKGGGHEEHHGGGSQAGGSGFSDTQRESVRAYYGDQARAGHCPPGLAKKNNGCLPPGQAKKWAIGQPLPPDVIVYDPDPEIVVRIGLPPPDHKFVRVAGDLLLIAVGTGMVVDAIEDLGKL